MIDFSLFVSGSSEGHPNQIGNQVLVTIPNPLFEAIPRSHMACEDLFKAHLSFNHDIPQIFNAMIKPISDITQKLPKQSNEKEYL